MLWTHPSTLPVRWYERAFRSFLIAARFTSPSFVVTLHWVVIQAIKIMDKAKLRAYGMGSQIKQEIAIMRVIGAHPSVVQLHQVLVTPTALYVVLELVTGGELFDRIGMK
jgi:serine/threonine protein kinase